MPRDTNFLILKTFSVRRHATHSLLCLGWAKELKTLFELPDFGLRFPSWEERETGIEKEKPKTYFEWNKQQDKETEERRADLW